MEVGTLATWKGKPCQMEGVDLPNGMGTGGDPGVKQKLINSIKVTK